MAATYTLTSRERNHEGKTVTTATIAYSNEPYSTGLIVTKEKLGFRNVIESLVVFDQGGGYAARFASGKIQLYQQDATLNLGPIELPEVSGNQTVTLKVVAVGW